MYVSTSEIVQKANSIVAQCGTRDPLRIARDLGIEVMYYPFNEQRGAYKVLMRNRFIFVKNDLHPVMENIVLLHELGHDALHREEATKVGGFKEFEIFNMRDNRMEYEANLFAAQISLPDDDFLELAERGYDTQQIARTLHSDINLVALKADTLISQGYQLCKSIGTIFLNTIAKCKTVKSRMRSDGLFCCLILFPTQKWLCRSHQYHQVLFQNQQVHQQA